MVYSHTRGGVYTVQTLVVARERLGKNSEGVQADYNCGGWGGENGRLMPRRARVRVGAGARGGGHPRG